MSMLRHLLGAALRGLADQLAINPRNLRLTVLLDDEENLLARVDAATVADLLNRAASKRVLRVKLGQVMFDFDLGSRHAFKHRHKPNRIPQRGK